MRGKRFAGASALTLALLVGVGGPAQAAGDPTTTGTGTARASAVKDPWVVVKQPFTTTKVGDEGEVCCPAPLKSNGAYDGPLLTNAQNYPTYMSAKLTPGETA